VFKRDILTPPDFQILRPTRTGYHGKKENAASKEIPNRETSSRSPRKEKRKKVIGGWSLHRTLGDTSIRGGGHNIVVENDSLMILPITGNLGREGKGYVPNLPVSKEKASLVRVRRVDVFGRANSVTVESGEKRSHRERSIETKRGKADTQRKSCHCFSPSRQQLW